MASDGGAVSAAGAGGAAATSAVVATSTAVFFAARVARFAGLSLFAPLPSAFGAALLRDDALRFARTRSS